MFGEHYFATSHRLSHVMHGIAGLAAETNTDLGDRLPLAEIKSSLANPFLFVVCGEVNAGKSTLINALFGHDLCRVNALPETQSVLWYRHGSPARDVQISPMLEQCFRPLEFLHKFNIIDTPGTNTNTNEPDHQDVTARFLPNAELILCVFPISNPWSPTTWNFISSLSNETLERVVLIIQQADQRESNDIQVILGHMSDLAMKRIGRIPPIFAVSGKIAYEAKLATTPAADHLQVAACSALENFISKSICQSPARRQALETCRGHAAAALRAVEDRIEEQTRSISTQNRFMDEIEREIDSMRNSFVTRLPRHLTGVAEVFESEAIWVSRFLRRKLRAFPSIIRLFSGDRSGPEMESAFIECLQSAVEAVAEKDGGEVVDACQAHWDELGNRIKDTMGVDLNSAEPIQQTLATARKHFVARLGRAARQGIGNLKVRNQLDKELRRRNIALKSSISTTLVLTSAGATCGALGVPWVPGILVGLSALFLTGGILTAWVTRKSIAADFQARLLDTCGTFASTLHTDYEDALRLVFRDYAASLASVRTHLAREKLAIEPRIRRWQELFLTLKAIEQDL
jgi:predicted GTPase